MRNTIKNPWGKELKKENVPSITMIRDNNISVDDIKFILKARRHKKRSMVRKRRVTNNIFDFIGVVGFFIVLSSSGVIEKTEKINLEMFKNMGIIIAIGLGLMGITWLRNRYIKHKHNMIKRNASAVHAK